MTLYSERRRLRAEAEREAAGEVLWSETFPPQAVIKLAEAWEVFANDYDDTTTMTRGSFQYQMASELSTIFRMEVGSQPPVSTPERYALSTLEPHQHADLLEAIYRIFKRNFSDESKVELFENVVNDILNSHRVAFKMIGGEIYPYSADPVYGAIVEPTIQLLVHPKFQKAKIAYTNALKEIQGGEPGDAVTDAGTALQEALTALGCKGNALGPLIKDARAKGYLAAHDSQLEEGITKMLHWVSADRSEMGDAHKGDVPTLLPDAWLTVYVVGALIIRLASDRPRAS